MEDGEMEYIATITLNEAPAVGSTYLFTVDGVEYKGECENARSGDGLSFNFPSGSPFSSVTAQLVGTDSWEMTLQIESDSSDSSVTHDLTITKVITDKVKSLPKQVLPKLYNGTDEVNPLDLLLELANKNGYSLSYTPVNETPVLIES